LRALVDPTADRLNRCRVERRTRGRHPDSAASFDPPDKQAFRAVAWHDGRPAVAALDQLLAPCHLQARLRRVAGMARETLRRQHRVDFFKEIDSRDVLTLRV